MVYDNSKDVNVFNFIYSIGGMYGNEWLQVGVFNTEPVVDTALTTMVTSFCQILHGSGVILQS